MSADEAQAHYARGNTLLGQGRLDEAATAFGQALALRPDYPAAHLNLGSIHRRQGRLEEAVAACRRAIALRPHYPMAFNNLGNALSAMGRLDEAIAAYQQALVLDPAYAEAHRNLGVVLMDADRLEEAEAAFRRTLALKPDHVAAHANLGVALQHLGRLEEAEAVYRRALALKPDHARALYNLVRQTPMNDGSAEAEAVFALLSRQVESMDRLDPQTRSTLLFAMGKALEERGEFDRAFTCLSQANAIRRAAMDFDVAVDERQMAGVAEAFDASLLQRLAGEGLASARPIFIVGMPRSGTTLVEQIISAHPEVHGAGEITAFPDAVGQAMGAGAWDARTLSGEDCRRIGRAYLDRLPVGAPGETRVTDKLVSNFLRLGLIHGSLPNSVIIHCQRDPRDACLSSFALPFTVGQECTHDLAELGRYWRAYDRLMAHWRAVLPPGRMLEVPYEAVVEDTETWARRLIAHCDLEWNDDCLRFHQSRRVVRSASFAQVRQPIYTRSVGRWRSFAGHLGPLLQALGEPWTDVG